MIWRTLCVMSHWLCASWATDLVRHLSLTITTTCHSPSSCINCLCHFLGEPAGSTSFIENFNYSVVFIVLSVYDEWSHDSQTNAKKFYVIFPMPLLKVSRWSSTTPSLFIPGPIIVATQNFQAPQTLFSDVNWNLKAFWCPLQATFLVSFHFWNLWLSTFFSRALSRFLACLNILGACSCCDDQTAFFQ